MQFSSTFASGKTVNDWTTKMRAASPAGFQWFNKKHYLMLDCPTPGVRVATHNAAFDATNAAVGADSVIGCDIDCLCRRHHIVVPHHLHLVDEVLMPGVGLRGLRYYSSVAKVVHLWRDYPSRMVQIWEGEYGVVSAWHACNRVVPAPIAGRWGRISEVEKFMLNRDIRKVLWRLRELCKEIAESRGAKKTKGETAREVQGAMAEIRAQAMAEHPQKPGRWARGALKVREKPEQFALAIKLAKESRSSLDHLLYYIEGRREFALAELVWGKGRQIAAEVDNVVHMDPMACLGGEELPRGVSLRGVKRACGMAYDDMPWLTHHLFDERYKRRVFYNLLTSPCSKTY